MRDALLDVANGREPEAMDEWRTDSRVRWFRGLRTIARGAPLDSMVGRFVAYMLAACVAVLVAGEIFQGGIITYTSVPAVLFFGLVLGLLNAFVKPVLEIIAAPLSCLTFGLISGALSFLIFGAAATSCPGSTPISGAS